MPGRITTTEPHSIQRQRGFTLIELLVVIVILGILAGVVVFAVRSSGDKGQANAVAIDARAIRTALEVYCAKNGHYPRPGDQGYSTDPMSALVAQKYLSSRSEYNTLRTTGPGLTEGNCNGTLYSLTPGTATTTTAPGGATTTTLAPTTDCSADPSTWRGPMWCPTGVRTAAGGLHLDTPNPVRLLDGRVMAMLHGDPPSTQVGNDRVLHTELYSPGQGTWTAGPSVIGAYPNMVVIGDAAGKDACSPNCGKVLLHATRDVTNMGALEKWYLYDPAAGATAPWTEITPATVQRSTFGQVSLAQIEGPNCGDNCGKILIGTHEKSDGDPFHPPTMRLFDPKQSDLSSAFSDAAHPAYPKPFLKPNLIGLPNGRILIFGRGALIANSQYHAYAELFHPAEGRFEVIVPPNYPWSAKISTPVLLPTGEMLATGFRNTRNYEAEVFDPDAAMPDRPWRSVSKCAQATDPDALPVPVQGGSNVPPSCYVLATVGSKVLTKTSTGPVNLEPRHNTGDVYLFDPGPRGSAGTWTKLSTVPPKESVGWGITLEGPGCEPHCGRALVIGNPRVAAYLFTP